MTLRQKLGAWILGGPSEADLLREALRAQRASFDLRLQGERVECREALSLERDHQKQAESEHRQESKVLVEGTLEVMRELVQSVREQHSTLSSYLSLFTSAPVPTVRSTDDSALFDFEKASQRKTHTHAHVPDPFAFLADGPGMFDPSTPDVLTDIKDSLGTL